ncbi:MAG TPA: murein biosynthesis integral membrane protein MurJ [Streptosporangiaceae bacterium]|nr:murein biosynthesis integral membrane protein MurJ [Streptosporangiaceae bacterium]
MAGHGRPFPGYGRHRGPSIVRSSGVMAAGTLISRVTGMLRTLVQAYALGAASLADAYNVANSLPNVVYNLMLGGILTSVIVPLLVSAARRDADRGEAYGQRMFTLLALALLIITIVASLAAAPIVYLYKGPVTGPELHLMVIFAYFFIPQIFFYGISSLVAAVLNARGSFAAPMWTPVINNVVVIGVLLAFTSVAGFGVGPATITPGEVQLLGLGTTLGVAAQTAALIPALRRAGFRWRPRFDFGRGELSGIRRMAGWMFGYIATTQVTLLVTTRVANAASVLASRAQVGYGAGYTPFAYAWQLFQMPYAIVGISVITALLPRMSAHAAGRRPELVTADFSVGLRLSSVIVVPSALVLAVLGPALAEVFLAHGATSLASARYVGEVFAVLCLGLVPYTVFQLQLRVFYALHDSRTPALIGVVTMILNVAVDYGALAVLPAGQVVAGVGLSFGMANVLGSALAWRLLRRRLGGLGGRAIGGSLLRMHAAAVPAAVLAFAVSHAAGAALPPGRLSALVAVVLVGSGALGLYLFLARQFKVTELTEVLTAVTERLRP